MNLAAGIFFRDGPIQDGHFFSKLILPYHSSSSWYELSLGNVHCGVSNDEISNKYLITRLFHDEPGYLLIVGEIILHNKTELNAALGYHTDVRDEFADVKLTIASYKKWGEHCVHYLTGEFAFAIYDLKEQIVFCARDHFGHKPFYYYADASSFLFANRIQLLSSFSFSSEFNESWIIDYLTMNRSYEKETVFKNIYRLEPGHILKVTKDEVVSRRFWYIDRATVETVSNFDEAVEGFRYHFKKAVHALSLSAECPGIELSSGIDSTSVAAMGQPIFADKGESLIAFSDILPQQYKNSFGDFRDEWEDASQVAKHVGIQKHIGIEDVVEEPLELLADMLTEVGYPANSLITLLQKGLYYKAKEQGVRALFSGYGGNELVSENASTRYLTDVMKDGGFFSAGKYFLRHGDNTWKAWAKAGLHYGRFLVNAEKREFELLVKRSYWNNLVLKDDLMHDIVIRNFHFAHAMYPPNQRLREKSLYRVYSTTAHQRVELGSLVTARYGIRYVYPMLYKPFMEYYYSLPDEWKASNKKGRAIIRAAMKDLLPSNIINGSKFSNSSTIPFYKVEQLENFQTIKDWVLSIPGNHFIYNYLDRNKIAAVAYSTEYKSEFQYILLKSIVLMTMFIDGRKEKITNAL
jgi:asparagine synthase (glutamine-hydrolysing)